MKSIGLTIAGVNLLVVVVQLQDRRMPGMVSLAIATTTLVVLVMYARGAVHRYSRDVDHISIGNDPVPALEWIDAYGLGDAIVAHGRCAACAYPLELERASPDGIVTCAECGCAWRAPLESTAAATAPSPTL